MKTDQTVRPIKRILIANRGEIAVRIIRACRELGIESCAVYSDADRLALHVLQADRAAPLGDPASRNSYLNIEKLLAAARSMGCDAVHPGYGFLAENAAFAARVAEEGLIFIGPPASCIEAMGSKTAARQAAKAAGVPVVPGAMSTVSESELEELASEIGFPVLLKASAGGGGKGMRIVRDPADLAAAYRSASSEAGAAFADASVYVERYFDESHHIEVQVLFDNHGNGVHLGERECSAQRRYQKVVEESPSPFIDDAIRRKMGECAVRLASSVGYRNAGTMEFLVDRDRNFYFLEMNTRLQVEHPVTEMVTSVDLVKEQIRIASGEPLGYAQDAVVSRGHAIECRIYAEDVENNFMPSPGKIVHLTEPTGGPGVRNDSGVYEGFTVPIHYDPMISKLVTWGRYRGEAIARMKRALREYRITGIKTTIPLMHMILSNTDFVRGEYSTSLIERLTARRRDGGHAEQIALAALAVELLESRQARAVHAGADHHADPTSPWKRYHRARTLRQS